jgi:hypothetical protein
LAAEATAPTLPALAVLLRDAAAWSTTLAEADVRVQRPILAALVARVTLERPQPVIEWTALGALLAAAVVPG